MGFFMTFLCINEQIWEAIPKKENKLGKKVYLLSLNYLEINQKQNGNIYVFFFFFS